MAQPSLLELLLPMQFHTLEACRHTLHPRLYHPKNQTLPPSNFAALLCHHMLSKPLPTQLASGGASALLSRADLTVAAVTLDPGQHSLLWVSPATTPDPRLLSTSSSLLSLEVLVVGVVACVSQEISALTPQHLWRCLVYCGCHATRIFANPFQMPHACHRFWISTCLTHFWQGAKTHCACHTKRRLNVHKSGPNAVRFSHFDFEKCFAPHRHTLFNTSTCKSGPSMRSALAFWLRNMLRATRHTFSTSQLPKVFRTCCALHLLTSKRVSRHSCILLQHRHFRKCSEHVVS